MHPPTFHLKVKHKILAIWLGSILLALALMWALFQNQSAALHRGQANTAIAEGTVMLQHELRDAARRTQGDAARFAAREATIASLNMISRYQDPAAYQPDVFDVEKRTLARELEQHARATDQDLMAAFTPDGTLLAYYVASDAGGQGAGFVTYIDGRPHRMDLSTPQPVPGAPQIIETILIAQDAVQERAQDAPSRGFLLAPLAGLVASAQADVIRTRATGTAQSVGRITSGRVIGATFRSTIERLSGERVHMVLSTGEWVPPRDDMGTLSPPAAPPALTLDSETPSTPAYWSDAGNYNGAVALPLLNGKSVTFVISHRKDHLEGTLDAFFNAVLWVLAITGLVIVPTGLVMLNRVITHPVERLAASAEALRDGRTPDMSRFSGGDEFARLADAFSDMAEAVRAREASLTEAQRIARLGNFDWHVETGHVDYSGEVPRIVGRTADKMGQSLDGLLACLHGEDSAVVKNHLDQTVETGHSLSINECRVIRPDGTERFVIINGELDTTTDGSGPVLRATIQDITERHMLEKAKSELISTVSHELRTPLTSIVGTLGLATGGLLGDLPDKLKSMLGTANVNAKRLGVLIDDLLDAERIASGTMQLDHRPLGVPDLIARACESNQAFADTRGVQLHIPDPVANVRVLGDEERLLQALDNLITNALKFSDDDVMLSVTVHDGEVEISVRDFGPGIPADFEPRVFERFAQADQSLTRANQKGGTGLGLAISKAIIEMHDGRIDFVTTREPAPDHGTTFTVTLPAA